MVSSVSPVSPVRAARPARVTPPPRPPLQRRRECAIAGVSEGLGAHLGAPVWAIRAMFVVLTAAAGAGVLLYAWFWVFMPWRPGDAKPSRRVPVAWLLVTAAGFGLIWVFGALSDPWGGHRFFEFVDDYGYGVGVASPLPLQLGAAVLVATVSATAAGMWAALIDRTDPARGPRHALVIRILASIALAVCFFASLPRLTYDGASVLWVAAMPLAGLLAVLSSTLVEKWRELSGERTKRIREEQRSEMAAHLHDSVLQTLALIQNRAGASSEAARLARAQERELRAWLYDGDAPADSDLATDLRDYAGGLELDYPARIDVVSAGLSTERASGELAAAAREAMLNAARHAGGDVSVYIEGGATGVDVFIRDRGAGFDLDTVPGDRLGVRESVIGRMRRAGGNATVRSDAGGTEVHLRIVGTGEARGH